MQDLILAYIGAVGFGTDLNFLKILTWNIKSFVLRGNNTNR